jgi:hypothetical protein
MDEECKVFHTGGLIGSTAGKQNLYKRARAIQNVLFLDIGEYKCRIYNRFHNGFCFPTARFIIEY